MPTRDKRGWHTKSARARRMVGLEARVVVAAAAAAWVGSIDGEMTDNETDMLGEQLDATRWSEGLSDHQMSDSIATALSWAAEVSKQDPVTQLKSIQQLGRALPSRLFRERVLRIATAVAVSEGELRPVKAHALRTLCRGLDLEPDRGCRVMMKAMREYAVHPKG